MIQEIYDYLWTRDLLINNDKDKIINLIEDKKTFTQFVSCFSKLMQEEDFVFINEEITEKVDEFVFKYRFDYADKENIEDINYIIGRIQSFRSKSDKEKKRLIDDFYIHELDIRSLPVLYALQKEGVVNFIKEDFDIFLSLVDFGDEQSKKEEEPKLRNIVGFASTINLLVNKYPEMFNKYDACGPMTINLNNLYTLEGLPNGAKRYLKKTIKKLENIEKDKQKRLIK